jgi:DNA-binding response OmpR family regulator
MVPGRGSNRWRSSWIQVALGYRSRTVGRAGSGPSPPARTGRPADSSGPTSCRDRATIGGAARRPRRLDPEDPRLRILIVEDQAAIAEAVKTALAADGHAPDIVGNGLIALEWAATYPYELIILDVVLPGLDGFSVCSRLRHAGFAAPILMLTALDDVEDRVTGLDRGADDYLAKPFSMDELRARIRALGRRRQAERAPKIVIGDLELDPPTLGVRRAGRSIRLTAREFALLELLARRPGQIFTRELLIDTLWNADFASESNIVEVYIRSLRRKVDEGRRDGLIETVRGSGYRLRAVEPA